MQMNHGGLRPAESSLVIQAAIEGLDPQQVLVRDFLVSCCGQEKPFATKYVQFIGLELVLRLKLVLQQASHPADAFIQFARNREVVNPVHW